MGGYQRQALGHRIAAVLVGIAPLVCSTGAQSAPTADVRRQVDEAFQEVITRTDSLEVRLKYARLLVMAENYEGGVAALEGLLLSPNAPPSVRVELAVLYYRLGSYATSEVYLRQALADPRLDSVLKKQAETMLIDVVRRNKVSSVTGRLLVTLRGQSNPTATSSENRVLSNGTLVPLEDQSRPKSDVDMQVLGTLEHVYDLGAQNEASIVTSLVALTDHYTSVRSYAYHPGSTKPYDVSAIAATTGIRFKPSPDFAPKLTVRPYLILGGELLNGHQYFTLGGIGFDGAWRANERLSWGGIYEHRRFSYSSRPDITNSSLASGVERVARGRAVIEVGANKILMGEIGFVSRAAQRGDFEFDGPEAKLAYVVNYANPVAKTGLNWTTTVVGSVAQRRYRAPDPAVDPSVRRRDTERRASLVNVMPITRDMALQIQFEYTDAPSSLPNYKYSNFAGSAGILWNF